VVDRKAPEALTDTAERGAGKTEELIARWSRGSGT
jgi:hypothetical protein